MLGADHGPDRRRDRSAAIRFYADGVESVRCRSEADNGTRHHGSDVPGPDLSMRSIHVD